MFKNSKVENRATTGSVMNYKSFCAQLAVEKLSKRWHIDENIVILTNSCLKCLRTGFLDM